MCALNKIDKIVALETEKQDISCLKSICFLNCVFLLCYYCPSAFKQSRQYAAHPLNGFPFAETRLTRKILSNRCGTTTVSCFPVGCVTSLVTIIQTGDCSAIYRLWQLLGAHYLPFPQKIVSPNCRTREFGDKRCAGAAWRHLVTETALAQIVDRVRNNWSYF